MTLYIWNGQTMIEMVLADCLNDAFRKASDYISANKFEVIGNEKHYVGIPKYGTDQIAWSSNS